MGSQSPRSLSQGCTLDIPKIPVHANANAPESSSSDRAIHEPWTRTREFNISPSVREKPPSYVFEAPGNEQASNKFHYYAPFRTYSAYEDENASHLPSPVSPKSEDSSQFPWCYSRTESPHQFRSPSLTRVVCSCCFADLYICGPCQQRIHNRPPLGKRIALVARRTLSKLGIKRKNAHCRSTSPARSATIEQFVNRKIPRPNSTTLGELEGSTYSKADTSKNHPLSHYHRPAADSGMSYELAVGARITRLPTDPAELPNEVWVSEQHFSAVDYNASTFSPVSAISSSRVDTPFPSLLQSPTSSTYSSSFESVGQESLSELSGESGKPGKTGGQLSSNDDGHLNYLVAFSESTQGFASDAVSETIVAELPIRAHTIHANSPSALPSSSNWIGDKETAPDRSTFVGDEDVTARSNAGKSRASTPTRDHVSPSELLEVLNRQSEKIQSPVPADLVNQLRNAYRMTIEESQQTPDSLNLSESRTTADLIKEIAPGVETGLSVLKTLVIGHVLHGLSEVSSLLFLSYSIVAMHVDGPDQAQFIDALSSDGLKWLSAVPDAEHGNFQNLITYLRLPTDVSPRFPHAHRRSEQERTPSRPVSTFNLPNPAVLEGGLLGDETEENFRCRNGLHAQICQWFVDCELSTCSAF